MKYMYWLLVYQKSERQKIESRKAKIRKDHIQVL